MKTSVPALVLVLTTVPLFAHGQGIPLTGARPADFVPPGYQRAAQGRAAGDLNGDGRPDVALVLDRAATDQQEEPRTLLVLWGQADGSYKRGLTATSAIMCATCGGLLGDPFEGLTITNRVLSIMHRGGSRERWRSVARFRYQQGDFYQIGDTYDVVDDAGRPCPRLGGSYRTGTEHRDANLLTGQYERVRVAADCRFGENSRGRQPVKPLVPLTAYRPQP